MAISQIEEGQGVAAMPVIDPDDRSALATDKSPRYDVFSGHAHGYYRCEVNGTTYIANGAESVMEGFSVMPSYLTEVEVRPDKISDRMITIKASFWERIYGRTLDSMAAHIYPRLRACLRMR